MVKNFGILYRMNNSQVKLKVWKGSGSLYTQYTIHTLGVVCGLISISVRKRRAFTKAQSVCWDCMTLKFVLSICNKLLK